MATPISSLTVVTRIRSFVRAMDWSRSRLAAEAGLNESTIRLLDDERWNPTVETLRKLEAIIPPTFEPSASGLLTVEGHQTVDEARAAPGAE